MQSRKTDVLLNIYQPSHPKHKGREVGGISNTSKWVVNGMGVCPVNNSIDGHSLTARNIPKVNKYGMVFADKLMQSR